MAPWLNGYREVAQRLIDGTVQAIALEKRDKNQRLKSLAKLMKLDDPQLLENAYEYNASRTPVLPYPKEEQFRSAVTTLSAENPKIRAVDLKTVIDASLVQSAADRGLDKK